MTTDSKPSNVVDIETAESNEDADIKIFGNNPEYQLDMYQKIQEYKKIIEQIGAWSSFIMGVSIIQAMNLIVKISGYYYIRIIIIIATVISGIVYIIIGRSYKTQKPWMDRIIYFGIFPCVASLNPFLIAAALWIYKQNRCIKHKYHNICNRNDDSDLNEIETISTEFLSESIIILEIPMKSRLYYLERYLLRQII